MRGAWGGGPRAVGGASGGWGLMRGIGGRACHGWRTGQILQLRADAHVMSECSDQAKVEIRGPGGCEQPRRYRMASGNGARISPSSVPRTITQFGIGAFVLESYRGHAIDLEPTFVCP